MAATNQYGQVLGVQVDGWTGTSFPAREPLVGRYCRLEPMSISWGEDAQLVDALYGEFKDDESTFTYMSTGPFNGKGDFVQAMNKHISDTKTKLFFVVVNKQTSKPQGFLALLDINTIMGSAEIGWVCFAPSMQRTSLSTEAHFLLLKVLFDDLGYRRVFWKCDSLNARSIKSAKRLGFIYEGTLRNHMVYKNRSRDTTYFGMIPEDWPARRAAFEAYLDPKNYNDQGHQICKLQRSPASQPAQE
mmetsp:Transcript_11920/g.19416  ORF Transcript_11920/g.19416 Transcript_11920/m.19416 type:complete len:245 (-) Transcript_11920:1366-2100(-)|eukprot:CAMPEP_0203783962 /NCGR_PEP_ID=MMETSP0100_2-20121128/203_1 /ASSEMBLY_ACC=CAM_ASM_000210 /TAXON_ID=96639 /ORGANISM=" , Strain NY0313808BC1" /LENGTH=244 /DNA_ID=CAMNT_0050685893 /DNA_START=327 /DNA_END=1061 /DNA_ORIENTATION=+